jgi:hypothetical protein
MMSPDYASSVAAVHRYDKDRDRYKTGGGVSVRYASGWYESITMDSSG